MVGKASDEKGVDVAPEVLAKYAGAYATTTRLGRPIRYDIYPSGRELWFSRDGGSKQQLTPVSNTTFVVPGGTGASLEFIEENGEIVALQLFGIAGDARLPRVRDKQ
jgi:hypothetical protein